MTLKVSRMLSAENSAKLSAQSPPWSRKASPRQPALKRARFSGEDERRIDRQAFLDGAQGAGVGIVRHLHPRKAAPG
jgi:hypothetical protein